MAANPLISPVSPPYTQNGGGGVSAMVDVDIDGTPMRVAALGLSAAIALAALRWAGFRFHIGV